MQASPQVSYRHGIDGHGTYDAENKVEQSRDPSACDQPHNSSNEGNSSECNANAVENEHGFAGSLQGFDAIFNLIRPFDV